MMAISQPAQPYFGTASALDGHDGLALARRHSSEFVVTIL